MNRCCAIWMSFNCCEFDTAFAGGTLLLVANGFAMAWKFEFLKKRTVNFLLIKILKI
jgi:hypothetical protein